RPTFPAQAGDAVGVVDATSDSVLHFVFHPHERVIIPWLGDVRKGAFANVHQLAVAPVRARGEIRPVVVLRVEESTLGAWRKSGFGEALADYSHQQPPFVNVVSRLMRP